MQRGRQDGVHEVAGRANFGTARKQAQLEAQRAADGLIPRVAGFCSGKHLSCFEGEDHCTYNNNFCLILVFIYIHFQLFYVLKYHLFTFFFSIFHFCMFSFFVVGYRRRNFLEFSACVARG